MLKVTLAVLFIASLAIPANARLPRGSATSGGGGGGALVNMVAVETTGSTQNNVPFSIGVPFDAGVISSGQHLVAVDGISGNPLVCDETNRYSDLTPSIRGTTLSCIIPSLTANVTDTIALSVASGVPATGTDITTADILATAYDHVVSIVDTSGNTFTASPRDALSSGNSAWVNTTTSAVLGKWRGGGGIVTGYVLYVPLKHTGTPHRDLYAKFDVECYKAATGAVSGGNPIRSCNTDVVMQNGVVGTVWSSSAFNDWYSLSIGAAGACANYPTVSPGTTTTLAANTAGVVVAATGTGFTAAQQGGVIDDGTGIGVITSFTNSTTIGVLVITPFASTSLTTGNYKIYGINHPYGARYRVRCGWAPSGAAPNVQVDNNNLYLGNPWNGGTLTGGPADYMISSKAILNYSVTTAATPTQATALITPANPSGYTAAVGTGQGNGSAGSWPMNQQQTGGFDGVGPLPDTYLTTIRRYDNTTGHNWITDDANKFNLLPYHFIDPATGRTPSLHSGTDWQVYNSGGTFPVTGTAPQNLGNWDAFPQSSHQADNYYFPYVLTGDWYWADSNIDLDFSQWAEASVSQCGSQMNRIYLTNTASTSVCGGGGMRGNAHAHKITGHLALILADSNTNSTPSPVLGWTKDDVQTYLENQYTTVNSGAYDTLPVPGTIIQLGSSACFGGHTCNNLFQTPGPRWTSQNNGNGWQQYQHGYMIYDLTSLMETGMLSTNGLALYDWLSVGNLSQYTDTTDLSSFPVQIGFEWWNPSPAGQYYDWPTLWQLISINAGGSSTNLTPRAGANSIGRVPSGTITFSGLSGTVTATIPTGSLGAGSWYNGGYILTYQTGSAFNVGACGPITVTSATTMTCAMFPVPNQITSTTWTNTTYTGWDWSIPFAKPGDTPGLEVAGTIALMAPGGGGITGDYGTIFQGATVLLCNHRPLLTGCPTASNTALGWGSGVMSDVNPFTWMIAPR